MSATEWSVYARHKERPEFARGYFSTRKPTAKEIREWREWHNLDDDWDVTVSEVARTGGEA